MGRMFYGSLASAITLTDDLLAYVRLITSAKLRNNESFMLSWHHDDDDAGDRSSVWLHPSIALRFVFDQSTKTQIDPARLARLHDSANGPSGLILPLSIVADDPTEVDHPKVTTLQRGARRAPRPAGTTVRHAPRSA